MKLRSLFLATAAALISIGFMVPRADAQTIPPGSTVVAYFNFDDPHVTGTVDKTPDLFPGVTQVGGSGIVGDNPGGGHEKNVTDLTIAGNPTLIDAPQILTGRTTGDNDPDPGNPGSAIGVRRTASNPSFTISFGVNTQFYAGLSLSFAVNNAGNGYHNVALSWTGADSGSLPAQAILTTTTEITFTLPPSVNGDGTTFKFITFTLTFTNGQSNGNNANESTFDNIQLTATTVVPEPATVWGGLLGVLGLCWFQRRRIRLILPRLRRT
jgi:hypothetical protein